MGVISRGNQPDTRHRSIVGLALMALVAAACTGAVSTDGSPPPPSEMPPAATTSFESVTPSATPAERISASRLRVADQRRISVERVTSFFVSPRGDRVVAVRGSRDLCVIALDDAATERCTGFQNVSELSIVWSPDGERVAFTEAGYPRNLKLDADLWILEADTGDLRNLTDDGEVQFKVSDRRAPVDQYPAWSPDGTRVAFGRIDAEPSTSLLQIAAEGGEPTPIASLGAGVLERGTRWSPDGRTVHYVWEDRERRSPRSGVYAVSLDDAQPRQVVTPQPVLRELGAETFPPTLLDIATNGSALVFFELAVALYPGEQARMDPLYAVVPRDGGELRSLRVLNGTQPPRAAALSPGGEVVAVTYESEGECLLAVQDAGGSELHRLASLEDLNGCGFAGRGRHPVWLGSTTLFVPGASGDGVIVTLAVE